MKIQKALTRISRLLAPVSEQEVTDFLLNAAKRIPKNNADDSPAIQLMVTPAWPKVSYDSISWSAFHGSPCLMGQSHVSLDNALQKLAAQNLP